MRQAPTIPDLLRTTHRSGTRFDVTGHGDTVRTVKVTCGGSRRSSAGWTEEMAMDEPDQRQASLAEAKKGKSRMGRVGKRRAELVRLRG